jgi:hypothetical protein
VSAWLQLCRVVWRRTSSPRGCREESYEEAAPEEEAYAEEEAAPEEYVSEDGRGEEVENEMPHCRQ